MRLNPVFVLLTLVSAACIAPTEEQLALEDAAVKMPKRDVDQRSRDAKIEDALLGIRKVAQQEELPNGWLLAGIAEVETHLTHCYDYASFKACPSAVLGTRGKLDYLTSPDCDGRPVVAGASDRGGCSEGGLGLFQLDAGSQSKTLSTWKEKGFDVLSMVGNVNAAMDILRAKVRLAAEAERLSTDDPDAWLRGIEAPDRADTDYEAYLGILANGYNGWDWGQPGWKKQKTKYHDGIMAVIAKHDAMWWKQRR